MLCLTRKAGERIKIGDQIEVEILKVKGRKVSIGIVAPTEIRIERKEAKAA